MIKDIMNFHLTNPASHTIWVSILMFLLHPVSCSFKDLFASCTLPSFSLTRVWTNPETGTRACSDRFTRDQRVSTLLLLHLTNTQSSRQSFSLSVRYIWGDPANRLLQRGKKDMMKELLSLMSRLLNSSGYNLSSHLSPSILNLAPYLSPLHVA